MSNKRPNVIANGADLVNVSGGDILLTAKGLSGDRQHSLLEELAHCYRVAPEMEKMLKHILSEDEDMHLRLHPKHRDAITSLLADVEEDRCMVEEAERAEEIKDETAPVAADG